MLTTQEEAQLLTNLLTDDDDWISRLSISATIPTTMLVQKPASCG